MCNSVSRAGVVLHGPRRALQAAGRHPGTSLLAVRRFAQLQLVAGMLMALAMPSQVFVFSGRSSWCFALGGLCCAGTLHVELVLEHVDHLLCWHEGEVETKVNVRGRVRVSVCGRVRVWTGEWSSST